MVYNCDKIKRIIFTHNIFDAAGAKALYELEYYIEELQTDINILDSNNRSLLYFACLNNRTDNIYYLLRRGISVETINTKAYDGLFPLFLTLINGNDVAFNLLIEYGADTKMKFYKQNLLYFINQINTIQLNIEDEALFK